MPRARVAAAGGVKCSFPFCVNVYCEVSHCYYKLVTCYMLHGCVQLGSRHTSGEERISGVTGVEGIRRGETHIFIQFLKVHVSNIHKIMTLSIKSKCNYCDINYLYTRQ